MSVLGGLFVWAGTVEPDPDKNRYPDESDIYENPEQYVGKSVSVVGSVVETDPLTVDIREGVRQFIAWYRENEDWYDPLVRNS